MSFIFSYALRLLVCQRKRLQHLHTRDENSFRVWFFGYYPNRWRAHAPHSRSSYNTKMSIGLHCLTSGQFLATAIYNHVICWSVQAIPTFKMQIMHAPHTQTERNRHRKPIFQTVTALHDVFSYLGSFFFPDKLPPPVIHDTHLCCQNQPAGTFHFSTSSCTRHHAPPQQLMKMCYILGLRQVDWTWREKPTCI